MEIRRLATCGHGLHRSSVYNACTEMRISFLPVHRSAADRRTVRSTCQRQTWVFRRLPPTESQSTAGLSSASLRSPKVTEHNCDEQQRHTDILTNYSNQNPAYIRRAAKQAPCLWYRQICYVFGYSYTDVNAKHAQLFSFRINKKSKNNIHNSVIK